MTRALDRQRKRILRVLLQHAANPDRAKTTRIAKGIEPLLEEPLEKQLGNLRTAVVKAQCHDRIIAKLKQRPEELGTIVTLLDEMEFWNVKQGAAQLLGNAATAGIDISKFVDKLVSVFYELRNAQEVPKEIGPKVVSAAYAAAHALVAIVMHGQNKDAAALALVRALGNELYAIEWTATKRLTSIARKGDPAAKRAVVKAITNFTESKEFVIEREQNSKLYIAAIKRIADIMKELQKAIDGPEPEQEYD